MTTTQVPLREPVGTSRLHTSEPRWPADRPLVDAGARAHVVVTGTGPTSDATLAAWLQEIDEAGATATVVDGSAPDAAATLGAALASATTGTRLLGAGNESVLARTLAFALEFGLTPPEIRLQLTDPEGPRPVRCVHCRAVTDTLEPVDGSCECDGCGVPLLIFPHFSRRLGAYLGFRIDAEELPA